MSILKKINKNNILVGIAIVGVIITGVLIFAQSGQGFSLASIFGMSNDEIGKKAVDYINNNQLSQEPASLVSVSEASGLVKVKIKIGSSEFDSYATKDGNLLFPQAFDMSGNKDDAVGANSGQTAEEIIAAIKKTDKPIVEAFVVSDCPFGLQMQRMIVDAVKSVPALASNVVVRYIGSISNGQPTSMHDASPNGEEAKENLRQICIREEQPAKYWNYLACYMKKSAGALPNGMPIGDSTGCQASTGVNVASLNACVADSGRGIAYAKEDFDLSSQYNTAGSPTLVVNGVVTSEFTADNQPVFGSSRSSDEIKTIICEASTTAPGFCATELNTAQAAASFSETYASVSGAADANTNCE